MMNLSEVLYHLYAKALVLLAYMLIELVLFLQYLKSDKRSSSSTTTITTAQYLRFIEEKNPTIHYTKSMLKQPDHVECRVCLNEFQEGDKLRNLKCQHAFHRDCLDKWLQQSCATCPLCRNKLLPDYVVAKYLNQNHHNHHHNNNSNEVDYYEANDDQLFLLLSSMRGSNRTLHRYL